MPRLKRRSGEAELREYLLARAVDLRDMYIDKLPEFEPLLSIAVNRLTRGEAFRFCRYELPDDHPARLDGAMGDLLVLTADDILTL